MARAAGDFDPEAMLRTLDREGVQFVLIGGMAAVLHGDVGVTVDVDIVPDRAVANLERLAKALRSLEAQIRAPDSPDGRSFDCSAGFYANLPPDAIVNMTTREGALDLTFVPSGTRGFPDLKSSAVELEVGDDLTVLVAALEDVIRSKEAAGREKDRLALPRLRRLLDRIRSDSQ